MNLNSENRAAHETLVAWARYQMGASVDLTCEMEWTRVERIWPKVPPEYQAALFAFYRHPGTATDKAKAAGMTLGTWRSLVTHGRRQVSHLLRSF